MKKSVTVILSIFCVFLTLAASSCTRTPPPSDNYGFDSYISNKKEVYVIGDTIEISIYLTNGGRKKQILTHKGDKPLYCAIYCEDENVYSESDETEKETTLKAILPWKKCIGGIDKTVTYKFEKAGEYTIKTYSEFTEYGKVYRYDAEDIILTVTE